MVFEAEESPQVMETLSILQRTLTTPPDQDLRMYLSMYHTELQKLAVLEDSILQNEKILEIIARLILRVSIVGDQLANLYFLQQTTSLLEGLAYRLARAHFTSFTYACLSLLHFSASDTRGGEKYLRLSIQYPPTGNLQITNIAYFRNCLVDILTAIAKRREITVYSGAAGQTVDTDSIELYDRSLGILYALPTYYEVDCLKVLALLNKARELRHIQRYEEALQQLVEAEAVADNIQGQVLLIKIQIEQGLVLTDLDRLKEAQAKWQTASSSATGRYAFREWMKVLNLILREDLKKDPRKSALAHVPLILGAGLQDYRSLFFSYLALAQASSKQGYYNQAADTINEALKYDGYIYKRDQAYALTLLAKEKLLSGDIQSADQYATQARQIISSFTDNTARFWENINYLLILVARQQFNQAKAHIESLEGLNIDIRSKKVLIDFKKELEPIIQGKKAIKMIQAPVTVYSTHGDFKQPSQGDLIYYGEMVIGCYDNNRKMRRCHLCQFANICRKGV